MHFKQETECESSEFIKSIPDQYTQFLNKNNHSTLHKYCRFSKIGNCYAIYLNTEEPKFIIGPDCKGTFKKGRFSYFQIY